MELVEVWESLFGHHDYKKRLFLKNKHLGQTKSAYKLKKTYVRGDQLATFGL